MSRPLFVHVRASFPVTEREARSLVRDWISAWLETYGTDTRVGVDEVSKAARQLDAALDYFEASNSGDNGK